MTAPDPSGRDHRLNEAPEVGCRTCGYDLAGITADRCPECGAKVGEPALSVASAVDESVWDEPALSPELAGTPRPGAVTYASWYAVRRASTTAAASWAATALVAAVSGPWAVVGAFWGSGQTAFSVLALIVFGPVIEELMKTAAAAYVVERRPYLVRTGAQVLISGAMSGLCFAAIENALYLLVYIEDPTAGLVAWRWTVLVVMHTGCSTIASAGLARAWSAGHASGRRPDLARAYPWMVAAIVVHGGYNLLAVAGAFETFTG